MESQHIRVAPPRARRARASVAVALLAGASLAATLLSVGTARASTNVLRRGGPTSAVSAAATPYPIGVFDLKEPSDLAPPPGNALAGYKRAFVDDFTSSTLGSEWSRFDGVPMGDDEGRFDPLHVAVQSGMLKVGTWRDPRFGDSWVSGGAGLWHLPLLYGAIFVRSRETAPGPDTTELLWPADNQWPPEIDFDEAGNAANNEMWFVHYDTPSDQAYGETPASVTAWHTWGVIWTPTSITFVVDGRAWGDVTASWEIPDLPMNLDLQAQSWCGISGEPCPTTDSALEVDWVEIYTPTS